MRLVLKLLCACGLALLLQAVVRPSEQAIDEIWFGVRVSAAIARGASTDAPELLDEAFRLKERTDRRLHEARRRAETRAGAWLPRPASPPEPEPQTPTCGDPEACR